jgi:hypothetical protein
MDEGVFMTIREVDRLQILMKIEQHKLTQAQAAKELNISLRQVQRIFRGYKLKGSMGLVSNKRGKPSNNKLNPKLKNLILKLVKQEIYDGFRPTLMNEKLKYLHNISVSIETTRQLMIQAEVWKSKRKKSPKVHQQRTRRASFGELVQIDGSPHAWLEDRGDPCVLIVYIDDATGQTYGRFFKAETTEAYMTTTELYIQKFGRPLAFYSDRHNIFRVNYGVSTKTEAYSQFGRALEELDIELICANSPQAKGRVERANQTLQDRLVKEMRLAKITSIEEANQYLEEFFWINYNIKFSRKPTNEINVHRVLLPSQKIERIFCRKENRKVSKNNEIQYKNTIYQIESTRGMSRLVVEVLENFEGKVFAIECKGKPVKFREYAKQRAVGQIIDSKQIDNFFREKKEYKVEKSHPWRCEGRVEAKRKGYRFTFK